MFHKLTTTGLIFSVCAITQTGCKTANSGSMKSPAMSSAIATSPIQAKRSKWKLDATTSALSDDKGVVASLPAETEITGWPEKKVRPELIFRCKDKKLEAYIVTGMSPNIESGLDDEYHIQIRFDKDKTETMTATKSTSGDALFPKSELSVLDKSQANGSWEAMILARSVQQHSTMAFGYTPFNSSPVETTFDLTGGNEAMSKIGAACEDAKLPNKSEIAESNKRFYIDTCTKAIKNGAAQLNEVEITNYIQVSQPLNKPDCAKDKEIRDVAKRQCDILKRDHKNDVKLISKRLFFTDEFCAELNQSVSTSAPTNK